MKTSLILALSTIIVGAAATYAVASKDEFRNQGGRDQWLPKQQVEAQLNQMGYRVHRLKTDDGCLEAYVTNRDGVRSELNVDPTTGKPGCLGKYEDRDD